MSIRHLVPNEDKSRVCVCLDSSSKFATDLEWHFFSEYMHGATIVMCDFRSGNNIKEVKEIISQVKRETSSDIFSILNVCGSEDMAEDIAIRGLWLLSDVILCRAIELIFIDCGYTYLFGKMDSPKAFVESSSKFLEIKISDKILKDRKISYDIDGVRQSKIATTIASIITAIEVAVTSES